MPPRAFLPFDTMGDSARAVGHIHAGLDILVADQLGLSPGETAARLRRTLAGLSTVWDDPEPPDLGCSDSERTMLRAVTEAAFKTAALGGLGYEICWAADGRDTTVDLPVTDDGKVAPGPDVGTDEGFAEAVRASAIECGRGCADWVMESIVGHPLPFDTISDLLSVEAAAWKVRFGVILVEFVEGRTVDLEAAVGLSVRAYWDRLRDCGFPLDEKPASNRGEAKP